MFSRLLTKMLYIYLELFLNKLGSGIKVGSLGDSHGVAMLS